MKLGEKIAMLRRERHWSQEELAMRLDISRQSVSKWESDASIPDLDKVVRLSEIFDVSIDYLLKEDARIEDMLKENAAVPGMVGTEPENSGPQMFSREEAEDFMNLTAKNFRWIAAGVSMCILSPVAVILLAGMAEYGVLPMTENQAGGIGLIILFLMVGAAVAIFILNGMSMNQYEYLEKEEIMLPDDCRRDVERRKQEFEPTFRGCVAAGVVLCILSVIPILAASVFEAGDIVYIYSTAFLLAIIAAGVYPIIWSAAIWGSFEKLLQVGEYTAQKKKSNKRNETIGGIYWGLITAVYLGISFYTMSWNRTWIIWPCAGVFYAVVCGIFDLKDSRSGQ